MKKKCAPNANKTSSEFSQGIGGSRLTSSNDSSSTSGSHNVVNRKSNIGGGNHTLDFFNFMVKVSKGDNERLLHTHNESEEKCDKALNEAEKSRDKLKPHRTSNRISNRNSNKPAVMNESKVSDEKLPLASKSAVKGHKRAHYDCDEFLNASLTCQLKRQKSMLNAKEDKEGVPKNTGLSECPDITTLISSSGKRKRGRPRKSLAPDAPKVADESTKILSNPIKAKMEISEAKSNATGLFEQKMWTDQYSPFNLTEMVLNSSDLSSLLSWLKLWDARSASSHGKMQSSGKKRYSDDYSFSEDSCDSSVSDSSSWRRSAYLVLGPTGCGKTCLVYTLALQFGFKVFELNPSSYRSGKEVIAQCSRVLISQHVSMEGPSASSSMLNLSKPIVTKSRLSQKPTLASFFQPRKQQPSSKSSASPKPVEGESLGMSSEGLKLHNKSLILFDEVDVLFDADRGFWVAVGKLLQMGRRPIIFTASDPVVIRQIPVPFQTCRLKPLQSPTFVKPILQRICDSQAIELTNSLVESLTKPDIEDRSCDIPNRISTTARQIISNREFFNIRQLIVRLQWLLGSKYQELDLNEYTVPSGKDLLTECAAAFTPIFSFSWISKPRGIIENVVEKPKGEDFGDIFDSESDKEQDRTFVEKKMDINNFIQVNVSSAQSKKISSAVLSTLSRYSEMQGLLDICSTQSGRNEISRGINALSTSLITSSSTTNLLAVFGDVCSAPLSGMDSEGTVGSFAGEENWNHLLHSITSKLLKGIQEELISSPSITQPGTGERVGTYINEPTTDADLLSLAFDKASGTLPILKAFSVERNSGESLFQQEFALDYLPALRSINNAENERRCLSTRRRFFHYFDQIGLRLLENIREYFF